MDFHAITDKGVFYLFSTASAPGPGPDQHPPGDVERHAAPPKVAGGAVDASLAHQTDGAVHKL